MVDLDACYFCGDIGETLRRHDVLPPEIAPDEERQRTVVLCHRCHRKLQTVVEPLVEALGEQSASNGAADGATDRDAATDEPVGQDPVADEHDDAPATETRPAAGVAGDEATASDSDDGPTTVDLEPTGRGAEAGDAGDAAAGDPVRANVPDDDAGIAIRQPEHVDEADETSERDESAESEAATDDRESATSEPGEPEGTGGPVGDDDAESSDGGDGAASGGTDRPAGYYKTLRFLRNRDLPMPRADAEELVSSAYDMDAAQCRRVLDVALEEGVLAEDGGQIRRA